MIFCGGTVLTFLEVVVLSTIVVINFLSFLVGTEFISVSLFNDTLLFSNSSMYTDGSIGDAGQVYIMLIAHILEAICVCHLSLTMFRLSKLTTTSMYIKMSELASEFNTESDDEEVVEYGIEGQPETTTADKIGLPRITDGPIREFFLDAINRSLDDIKTAPLLIFFYGDLFMIMFTISVLFEVLAIWLAIEITRVAMFSMSAIFSMFSAVALVRQFTRNKHIYDFGMNMYENITQGTRMDVYFQILFMNTCLYRFIMNIFMAAETTQLDYAYIVVLTAFIVNSVIQMIMNIMNKKAIKYWFFDSILVIVITSVALAVMDFETTYIVVIIFNGISLILATGTITQKVAYFVYNIYTEKIFDKMVNKLAGI